MKDSDSLVNSRTAAATADFYSTFWDLNDDSPSPFDAMRGRFIVNAIQRYRPQNDNLRFLDIGCGRGWLARFIAPLGDYTGVDFSEPAIEFARQHYSTEGRFVVGDPDDLYLGIDPEPRFDVVICTEVIEHVVDHSAFVRQMSEFLNQGSLIVLTTPNGQFYAEISRRYLAMLQPIERWLTPNQLVSLFQANAFSIREHYGACFRNIDYGPRGWPVFNFLEPVSEHPLLRRTYGKLLLNASLYQFMIAKFTP